MINIGPHLSISKGYKAAGENALAIGANTFQFFTRNPRGGKAKAIDVEDVNALKGLMEENNFAPLLAHAPYTLNMCSKDEKTRFFARLVFEDDLKRLEQLPCNLYTFHPGSHVGQGIEKGIELITEILNEIIREDHTSFVLLETMSGKGSEVGSTFEELRTIIDKVNFKEKIGVCLDTCHVYSAGYDIINDLDGVLNEFDTVIGIERLKAIHLNDSKMPFSSNKDRHEKIGEGVLGIETILEVVNNSRLKGLPFLLETPNELEGYKKEIELIKSR